MIPMSTIVEDVPSIVTASVDSFFEASVADDALGSIAGCEVVCSGGVRKRVDALEERDVRNWNLGLLETNRYVGRVGVHIDTR
jgi:hypothetical protein